MLEADERWSVNQVYVYLTGIFPSPNEALSELMRAVYFGRLPITASGPTEAFPEAFQKSAFQSGAFQSASAGESMSYELDASWFPNHLTLRPREGGGVEIFPTRAIRAGPEIPLAILKEIVGSEAVAEEVETSIDRFNEIKFTARASVVRRLWPTTSIQGHKQLAVAGLKGSRRNSRIGRRTQKQKCGRKPGNVGRNCQSARSIGPGPGSSRSAA